MEYRGPSSALGVRISIIFRCVNPGSLYSHESMMSRITRSRSHDRTSLSQRDMWARRMRRMFVPWPLESTSTGVVHALPSRYRLRNSSRERLRKLLKMSTTWCRVELVGTMIIVDQRWGEERQINLHKLHTRLKTHGAPLTMSTLSDITLHTNEKISDRISFGNRRIGAM